MNKNITPFAQAVYDLVSQIPKGKVSTYKIIAEAMNKPKACRAVGMALSINPFAPEVPCHRVISSDYSIGGFFGTKNKLSRKVQDKLNLLIAEGIKFDGFSLDKSSKYRNDAIFRLFS